MEERNGIIYTAHSEGIYKRRNKLNRTLTSKNLRTEPLNVLEEIKD